MYTFYKKILPEQQISGSILLKYLNYYILINNN